MASKVAKSTLRTKKKINFGKKFKCVSQHAEFCAEHIDGKNVRPEKV